MPDHSDMDMHAWHCGARAHDAGKARDPGESLSWRAGYDHAAYVRRANQQCIGVIAAIGCVGLAVAAFAIVGLKML